MTRLTADDVRQIARMIDHSLLHPTMTDEDLRKGCLLARMVEAATVCIKPYAVPMARELLKGSSVGVCTVVGFPHGGCTTALKAIETESLVLAGATEIDMVVNIGKVLSRDWAYVEREVRLLQEIVAAHGALLKVIFENDYLTDELIIELCRICSNVRVAFVKTSTGYGFVKQPDGHYDYRGATEHHVRLMRQHTHPSVQIKAAGGVRTLDDVLRMKALGVTRIGASATAAIVGEARRRAGLPPLTEPSGSGAGY